MNKHSHFYWGFRHLRRVGLRSPSVLKTGWPGGTDVPTYNPEGINWLPRSMKIPLPKFTRNSPATLEKTYLVLPEIFTAEFANSSYNRYYETGRANWDYVLVAALV